MELLVALTIVLCSCWFLRKWWKLNQIEKLLRKQGVDGPPGSPWTGGVMPQVLNMRFSFKGKDMDDCKSHDILGRILPDFTLFSKLYGVPHFFWWSQEPKLVVKNPEHAREFLSKQASSTGRSMAQKYTLIRFLGYGLVSVDGEEWAHHRRVVSPAFHLEKLKNMIRVFEECTVKMLSKWKQQVEQGTSEMDVCEQISMLTADIISRTAFGSNYEKGQRVFEILDMLATLFTKSATTDWIPFSRRVPTKHNMAIWGLQKEVDTLLADLIQERKDSVKSEKAATFGDDLLGLMLAESQNDGTFDTKSLVGECKTFYLAGHETTTSLLAWAMYLLAINPEWQARAREEVHSVLRSNNDLKNVDVLNRLKLVGMILYEALRLYPPASFITRYCVKDVQIGSLTVPKGTSVDIPIVAIHHDKELWGDDVNEFKPERFKNGISRASKHPNAFMAFSFGPRICVGQSFALLESKLVLALLLDRFAFSLSHSYKHCPYSHITLKPSHGLQLVLESRKFLGRPKQDVQHSYANEGHQESRYQGPPACPS